MAKNGKVELVDKLVEVYNEVKDPKDTRLSKRVAKDILNAFEEAVKELVAEDGDTLDMQGFVRFEKYLSKERNAVNPQTQEPIVVPAKVRTRAKAKF